MEILDLVRRAARERLKAAFLEESARGLTGEWRLAETTLAGEIAVAPRRSRRLAEAFARVAAASGSTEARGRAARLTASLLTHLGEFGESRRAYREAISLLDGAARDGARIGLAAAEMRLGRFDAARSLCRAVRRDAKARNDVLLAAAADLNEAVALHEQGRPKASIALYERARSGFASAKNPRMHAKATLDLANALTLLDRYAEAAPLYAEAASSFDAMGQTLSAARSRYNHGALCVAMERLGDADTALREAEARFRAAGESTLAALARLDRGEAMLRAGLAPEARRLFESARAGLARGAPPGERLRATTRAARAALASGDARAARRLAASAQTRGLRGTEAERDEILGRALALSGRFAAARTRLERAAKSFGSERPAGRARSLAAAAWCATKTGRTADARRLAAAARRASSPLGVAGIDFACAAVSFLLEDTEGRRADASRALDDSVTALERVRAGLGTDAMRAALLAGREAWLARAVRHALAGPGGDEAALALVERFRARSLIDLLGAVESAAPRDERIAKLRARVATLEKRAEGASQPAFLRSAASAPAAREIRAAERALAEAMSVTAPLRDATDLRARRAALPLETVVLSLFADETDTFVFAVCRDDVVTAIVPFGSPQVAALAEELRYTIGKFALGDDFAARHAARLSRDVDARLAQLSALCLGPVEEMVRAARRVVIVPHGPWHRVPFAALPLAGGPLVDRAEVALTPAFGALGADVPSATGTSLVLSAADVAAPAMDDEARAVAQTLGDARLLTGDDACFDSLAAARAPRCVHIAAHGRFRSDAPAMGGVRLSDGWLRALDIATLPLPGALVVLSGCETGLSGVGPGDEVHGLVRGVFASGAAELVASLWRVGDAATSRFMTAFHAHRAHGLAAESALAAAQRDARGRGEPVWTWAGFSIWTRRLRESAGVS